MLELTIISQAVNSHKKDSFIPDAEESLSMKTLKFIQRRNFNSPHKTQIIFC